MKHHAPAAERNREPILAALAPLLGERARVLEVGSGTGQHVAFFTGQKPGWQWQPTDTRAEALASIAAYRAESKAEGFLAPVALDAKSANWPPGPFDAVFSANVVHITPWAVAVALVKGAARVLGPRGKLILYGPFRFRGELTPDSNRAFDEKLRAEDSAWGSATWSTSQTKRARSGSGNQLFAVPANNHVVVFTRSD